MTEKQHSTQICSGTRLLSIVAVQLGLLVFGFITQKVWFISNSIVTTSTVNISYVITTQELSGNSTELANQKYRELIAMYRNVGRISTHPG